MTAETEDEALPPPHRPLVVMTRRQKLILIVFLLLCVIMSGGALVSQQIQQNSFEHQIAVGHAQRLAQEAAQENAVDAKLCKVMDALTKLNPPAGSPTDKSRSYLIAQHNILDQLGSAIGCKD